MRRGYFLLQALMVRPLNKEREKDGAPSIPAIEMHSHAGGPETVVVTSIDAIEKGSEFTTLSFNQTDPFSIAVIDVTDGFRG